MNKYLLMALMTCFYSYSHGAWFGQSEDQSSQAEVVEKVTVQTPSQGSNIDLTLDGNVKFTFKNVGQDVTKIVLLVLEKMCGVSHIENEGGSTEGAAE